MVKQVIGAKSKSALLREFLEPDRVAVTAGAAVLPDIDHPGATCAREFGFVTEAWPSRGRRPCSTTATT